jgi:hypothetical protein
MSPWIVGLCAVEFEKTHGATVCAQWPPNDDAAAPVLTATEQQSIAFHSLRVSQKQQLP